MKEAESYRMSQSWKVDPESNMPEEESVTLTLTGHALDRIEERFGVDDLGQIKEVLEDAATKGFAAADGSGLMIEHGCLLVVGNRSGDEKITVTTVLDLSDGIPSERKERMRRAVPTPWRKCEVEMLGRGRGTKRFRRHRIT